MFVCLFFHSLNGNNEVMATVDKLHLSHYKQTSTAKRQAGAEPWVSSGRVARRH